MSIIVTAKFGVLRLDAAFPGTDLAVPFKSIAKAMSFKAASSRSTPNLAVTITDLLVRTNMFFD
jgi:hypothetical protein